MRVLRHLMPAALIAASLALSVTRATAGPVYWLNDWDVATVEPILGSVEVTTRNPWGRPSDSTLEAKLSIETNLAYYDQETELQHNATSAAVEAIRDFRVAGTTLSPVAFSLSSQGYVETPSQYWPSTGYSFTIAIDIYSETDFIDGFFYYYDDDSGYVELNGGGDRHEISSEDGSHNLGYAFDVLMAPGDYQVVVQYALSSWAHMSRWPNPALAMDSTPIFAGGVTCLIDTQLS